ncbi:MAG: bifunctional N-acetylglucosamine-1-phosphate uridyltransferase/glucosamine-1-phosphate acetyltransferase [Alphaproteobacteria bacterium]|nr:MAG: bifunctional N-acetylglucosamine-1-phosphate uridyltransferase/glucosamine-1-phosphate acetyltransferase [Alphaproteobacteria bacterium]
MKNDTAAIILAAGKGTRMKSTMPKVLHCIANEPMITHVLRACDEISSDNIIVVIGEGMDTLKNTVAPARTIVQTSQNGTGDAAKSARDALGDFDGSVFILLGDVPLIKTETLQALKDASLQTGLAVLGFETNAPHGYGRLVVEDDKSVSAIVEEKDCTDEQRAINICNSGAFCVDGKKLFTWLDRIENNNAQGEYYLTDIVSIARQDGVQCSAVITNETEVMGINARHQLAQAEGILQTQLRAQAMSNGVTMIDPNTVYLSVDTNLGNDVIIEPHVYFGTHVSVESGTRIRAFSHLEKCSVGQHSEIGPFARIRPQSKIGNHVSVGNFIEVNRSELKDGAKSKHISYLGDAVIGSKTNIGAGTIIANYDGFTKHTSHIGEGVFVGSNSTIISPITIDDGAIIAAGSIITENVDKDALAIARAAQSNLDGWAIEYREKKQNEKNV